MRGILRVIPASTSRTKQRIVVMAKAPSLRMLEDVVGALTSVVESFDTVLHEGEAVSCKVYCRKGAKRDELRPNDLANLLWLQAQVRRDSFSGTSDQHDYLAGPVVILHGDLEFLAALS